MAARGSPRLLSAEDDDDALARRLQSDELHSSTATQRSASPSHASETYAQLPRHAYPAQPRMPTMDYSHSLEVVEPPAEYNAYLDMKQTAMSVKILVLVQV